MLHVYLKMDLGRLIDGDDLVYPIFSKPIGILWPQGGWFVDLTSFFHVLQKSWESIKWHHDHTGAKILNLFKNSHFKNLNFDKIHILKISFFDKNSHFKNHNFLKIHINSQVWWECATQRHVAYFPTRAKSMGARPMFRRKSSADLQFSRLRFERFHVRFLAKFTCWNSPF